jgi:outer membrane protein assembly factor BamB
VVSWTVLDGAAVLPAPVIGPEGNLYVTTGQGPGTSHLHAFNRRGELLWRSAPQATPDDLDSAAAISAPVVGRDGTVFVGDRNQFWAFRPNGTVKWVVPLPGPMASAIFTREGFVGGVTLNGKVVFYNPANGTPAVAAFDLPGGSGPAPRPVPPGLWKGGLMHQSLTDDAWQLFLGRKFEVTNTPASHPVTGRLFVPAAGMTPATGTLYGLDLKNGTVTIAFAASMGPGSGTSPAVSHDGTRVYAADGAGVLSAFDSKTGAVRWQVTQANATSSPTVGADETVYTGGNQLTAISGKDGIIRWSKNYNAIAAAALPVLPANPPAFLTGQPVARTNSVITATANRIVTVLALGYEYTEPVTGTTMLQPRAARLVTIAPLTGGILSSSQLRDTSEGIVSAGATGQLYVAHAGFLSSIFFFGLNQLLPPPLRMLEPPKGGFTGLGAVSTAQVAIEGMDWARSLNAFALTQLPGGDLAAALTAVRRSLAQSAISPVAVREAQAVDQITAQTAAIVVPLLNGAVQDLTAARQILNAANPTPAQQLQAASRILQAQSKLDASAVALQK